MTAEKILEIARREIGEHEFPPNSNNVLYNTWYYGHPVKGPNYAWCCVWVAWVFNQAGAPELFYGGEKTAYCPTLKSYHKKQAVKSDYQPGDIIFFNFSGKTNAAHVGICESFDGTYITTIDGNTGTGNEANGGAVMRRKRSKKYIVGAYRPAYKEDEMTEEQVKKIARAVCAQLMELDGYPMFLRYVEQYRDELKKKPPTMPDLLEEAKSMGLTDGSRPRDFVTREECAVMSRAAAKK